MASTVLTYGIKVPSTGDKGSTFFPDLEDNFTQIDAHTHDGVTSPPLTVGSVAAIVQTIADGGWSGPTAGYYTKTIAMGSSLEYDEVSVTIRASDGDPIYCKLEKITATSFKIYSNTQLTGISAVYA